jgi:hypothetical protein
MKAMKKSLSPEFFVLLAILVCLAMIRFPLLRPFHHVPVDNSPTLSHRVKSAFGMDLLDLQRSLTLTPVITNEEPFVLTYSMPLKLDVATWAYQPSDTSAQGCEMFLDDNGNDAHAYEITRQTNGTYLVKWNTIYESYGPHTLQIHLFFPGPKPHTVEGPKRIEMVTNILQIEPGTESFGSRMWFHAFLHVPSADYRIDIFDTNKALLKTIAGHTERGVIDEIWDLKTTNGQVRQDEEFYSEIYVTPTVTDTNGLIRSNAPTVRVQYP